MPPSHLTLSYPPLSGRYLSFSEREQIALFHVQRHGVREIARRLGRAASTISRELRRNAATRSSGLEYRAATAQWHADRATRRPKLAKLAIHAALRQYVQNRLAGGIVAPRTARRCAGRRCRGRGAVMGAGRLAAGVRAWSPAQIAHRLPRDFPDDPTMRISHEAIYQALYVQGCGALRRDLTPCLRHGANAPRAPRPHT